MYENGAIFLKGGMLLHGEVGFIVSTSRRIPTPSRHRDVGMERVEQMGMLVKIFPNHLVQQVNHFFGLFYGLQLVNRSFCFRISRQLVICSVSHPCVAVVSHFGTYGTIDVTPDIDVTLLNAFLIEDRLDEFGKLFLVDELVRFVWDAVGRVSIEKCTKPFRC